MNEHAEPVDIIADVLYADFHRAAAEDKAHDIYEALAAQGWFMVRVALSDRPTGCSRGRPADAH